MLVEKIIHSDRLSAYRTDQTTLKMERYKYICITFLMLRKHVKKSLLSFINNDRNDETKIKMNFL